MLNDEIDVEAFLDHHGVKGQKWGIRNKSTIQPRSSSEHKRSRDLKKKPVHALTNKQLKDLNARLQLEKTHRQLNPTSIDKGRKHVKGVLATATGAASAYALINSPLGKAAMSAGQKFMRERAIKRLVLTM